MNYGTRFYYFVFSAGRAEHYVVANDRVAADELAASFWGNDNIEFSYEL